MRGDSWYEWPKWAKDAVVTDVDIHLGWLDLLRLIARRRARVTVKVFTENVIGKTLGMSDFTAPRIFPRRSAGLVQGVEPEK